MNKSAFSKKYGHWNICLNADVHLDGTQHYGRCALAAIMIEQSCMTGVGS